MDLALSPEQEQLVESVAALLAKHAGPEQVRAAEPGGFDPSLWARLGELGVVEMGVPEAAGGWGASLLDLALVAEQLGRAVAPAPVVEAQVGARLLAAVGHDVHPGCLVTVALHPLAGDRAPLVPAAAVADAAVVLDDDRLLLVELDGRRTPVGTTGDLPVADVEVDRAGAVELAGGAAAHAHAVDEWLALTASVLVGVGARGLELGVDYAKERHAFGVPIGSFQGVAHPLVDSSAAVDGARWIARKAAWAEAEQPGRFAELAAMAMAWAYESARDATYRSLHVHGGYGFMLEYDVQLHWRRARGLGLLYGDPTALHRRVADARYGVPA